MDEKVELQAFSDFLEIECSFVELSIQTLCAANGAARLWGRVHKPVQDDDQVSLLFKIMPNNFMVLILESSFIVNFFITCLVALKPIHLAKCADCVIMVVAYFCITTVFSPLCVNIFILLC